MSDLFAASGLADEAPRPLADRLRPRRLEEVVGQDHLLGPDGPLGRMLARGRLASVILWGPPGVGKTTIARLLADAVDLDFQALSAVFSGVADLRKAFEAAKARRATGRGALLFVDEIHRFNRAQQDAFLPYVEDGAVTLVGATTENPSFELNAALLSRAQVLTLRRLDAEAMAALLARVEAHAGVSLPLTEDGREALIAMADGDGRYLLNLAEEVLNAGPPDAGAPDAGAPREGAPRDGTPSEEMPGEGAATTAAGFDAAALAAMLQRRAPVYDKDRDGHFDLISALHKSVRGSDPDASLYWLARMLTAGEDPHYVLRRVVRMAVEDIGLADPQALTQALAAKDAYDFLGSPEGELAIAQAVVYCATAPKSNAAYVAWKGAAKAAKETGSARPPDIILNAPTKLMKTIGRGAGYVYDHDAPDAFSGQNYFPDGLARPRFYDPPERGFERELLKRLDWWARLRRERG